MGSEKTDHWGWKLADAVGKIGIPLSLAYFAWIQGEITSASSRSHASRSTTGGGHFTKRSNVARSVCVSPAASTFESFCGPFLTATHLTSWRSFPTCSWLISMHATPSTFRLSSEGTSLTVDSSSSP